MARTIRPPTVDVVRDGELTGAAGPAGRLGALVRRLRGADVVHVHGAGAELRRAAIAATLAGVRAMVVTPIGPLAPLPWWHRRIARFVVPNQEEARRLHAGGIPLGRLVVARDDEALQAVYVEVAEMGR